MNAAVATESGPLPIELPLDPALVEELDEAEALALLVGRYRHFTGLGLAWAEALACAVGDRRAERFVAGRVLSA